MSIERQFFFWAGALALLALALYLLSGVMLPFAAGLALGYLLDPVANRLERWGLNRLGAALIILILFVLLFIGVLIVVVPVLAHQLAAFIDKLPDYVMRLQALAAQGGGGLVEKYGGDILGRLGLSNSVSPEEIQKSIGGLAAQGAQYILSFLRGLISGGAALISLFSLIVVTPIVAFYILVDWAAMLGAIDSWLPLKNRGAIRSIAGDIDRALAGFIRGQSLVCLILGLWYGIGLSLIGLNFGFLIGFSAGLLSFIPYVGSLTALVLSLGVAIVQGWPSWTLPLEALAIVGVGQMLEGNVLAPKLVGASVGLHPVWLMFALFAFGSLFGFTGLILAVPAAAALGVLTRFFLKQYLASPLYRGGA